MILEKNIIVIFVIEIVIKKLDNELTLEHDISNLFINEG